MVQRKMALGLLCLLVLGVTLAYLLHKDGGSYTPVRKNAVHHSISDESRQYAESAILLEKKETVPSFMSQYIKPEPLE
ncbi:hypothetical protein Q7A53_13605 [Halobacillus rhizosphaerae]|uniref:hypothetical protein n=1 Tax=Halobacillus rhizosphaerae TaxID=3064889 RepID=UPI00398AFF4A